MLSTRPRIDWSTEFIPSHELLCLGKGNTIYTLFTETGTQKSFSLQWTFSSRWVGSGRLWWDFPRNEILGKKTFQVCGNSAQALSALGRHFLQLEVLKGELSNGQEDLGLSSAKFLSFVVFVFHMPKHFSRDWEQHKAKSANSIAFSPSLLNNSGAPWMVQFRLNSHSESSSPQLPHSLCIHLSPAVFSADIFICPASNGMVYLPSLPGFLWQ